MTLPAIRQEGITQIRLKEWESRSASKPEYPELRGVHLEDEASQAMADRLTRSRTLVIRDLACGLEIAATSYVGRVRLGNIEITVEPKVGGDLLLRLFRYAYGLRDLQRLPPASYATGGSLFVELLVSQLHAEARELLARGLHRRYEPRQQKMLSPRGRIDMQALAAHSGRVDEGLLCRHHPRTEDTVINRVLLGGLKLARTLTSDASLRSACNRLISMLEVSVTPTPLGFALLQQANRQMSRLVRAYRTERGCAGKRADTPRAPDPG